MKKEASERSSFSGKFGYVMAAAGSAVGLGNIWRFPYLAAKYGGGIFLLLYLVLSVTIGYTLIVSESALGRMTRKSPVGAFSSFSKKPISKASGWINAVVPMLIAPYYCVIGGWVLKYFVEYCKGSVHELADDAYFGNFIANSGSVELWFIVFAVVTLFVVFTGVTKGVERVSKVVMPLLVVIAILIAGYSMTRPGALEGVKYMLVPNFKNFSIMTVVSAMGQVFYSLSIGMGILYTYGSYLKKDVDIENSTNQVIAFDTAIAILSSLMIIPAVFAFAGGTPEALNAGPALMFITLPKVFDSLGFGTIGGMLFFILVLFAALTSSISLVETSVSTFEDELHLSRTKSSILMGVITIALGTLSALGFGVLDMIHLPHIGSILDIFDFLTNSIMMPIGAAATCFLIIKVVGTKKIEEEVSLSSKFRLKKMYDVLIKYIIPVCLIVVLLSSIANAIGLIEI